ncbi:hypothetical protein ACRAWF_16700 [Streptomyces sp. L7]
MHGVIPLVWVFGPRIWLLYVVLPLCEAVGMLFSVGYVTVVRGLVGTEQLTEANGQLNASAAAAGALGPPRRRCRRGLERAGRRRRCGRGEAFGRRRPPVWCSHGPVAGPGAEQRGGAGRVVPGPAYRESPFLRGRGCSVP